MGISAILQIVKLIVHAVNDTTNALGTGSTVDKLGAYGNLFPDILGVIGNIQHVPAEIKDIDGAEVGDVVKQVADELDLPGEKADAIVKTSAGVFNTILGSVINGVETIAGTVKEQDVKVPKSK